MRTRARALDFELEGELAVLDLEAMRRQGTPPKPRTPPKQKARSPKPKAAAKPEGEASAPTPPSAPAAVPPATASADVAPPPAPRPVASPTAPGTAGAGDKRKRAGDADVTPPRAPEAPAAPTLSAAVSLAPTPLVYIRKHCLGKGVAHLMRTSEIDPPPDEEAWSIVPEDQLKCRHRVECTECKATFVISRKEELELNADLDA